MAQRRGRKNAAGKRPRPARSAGGATERWSIEVDVVKCSLCEVCARECPSGALVVRVEGGTQELVFVPPLCDACHGEVLCRQHCPEEAIRISARRGSWSQAVLVRSRLVSCQGCGTPFVAEAKLSSLEKRTAGKRPELRALCPECRRKRLAAEVAR